MMSDIRPPTSRLAPWSAARRSCDHPLRHVEPAHPFVRAAFRWRPLTPVGSARATATLCLTYDKPRAALASPRRPRPAVDPFRSAGFGRARRRATTRPAPEADPRERGGSRVVEQERARERGTEA